MGKEYILARNFYNAQLISFLYTLSSTISEGTITKKSGTIS